MKETRRWKLFELLAKRAVRDGKNYVEMRLLPEERPLRMGNFGNVIEWRPASPFMLFLAEEGFHFERQKSDKLCWDFELFVTWERKPR